MFGLQLLKFPLFFMYLAACVVWLLLWYLMVAVLINGWMLFWYMLGSTRESHKWNNKRILALRKERFKTQKSLSCSVECHLDADYSIA